MRGSSIGPSSVQSWVRLNDLWRKRPVVDMDGDLRWRCCVTVRSSSRTSRARVFIPINAHQISTHTHTHTHHTPHTPHTTHTTHTPHTHTPHHTMHTPHTTHHTPHHAHTPHPSPAMEHYKKKQSQFFEEECLPNEIRITATGKAHDLATRVTHQLKVRNHLLP